MSAFYANAPLPDTNARQTATVIRMPSTALLTIDSEDRYSSYAQSRSNPTSPYNFSISKSESLMPGFITRIGVSEVCFPWAVPNINAKTRSINFVYERSGDVLEVGTLNLPIGFYTPAEIAELMTTALNEALVPIAPLPPLVPPATVQFSYGVNNVYTSGALPCFSYVVGDISTDTVYFTPMTPNTAAYPYSAQSKQLFDLLGFTAGTTLGTAPNPVINIGNTLPLASGIGGYTLCQAIRYVDIVCSQLTNSQAQKDQTSQTVARDMLCRLYLGAGSGDGQSTIEPNNPAFCPPGCAPMTIYRDFAMPKQIQWIPNQNIPGFLQFQVYDDVGDLLDVSLNVPVPAILPPDTPGLVSLLTTQSLDWSMTMLVSEV